MPAVAPIRVRGTEREVATVVGPLGTPPDVLAGRAGLARAGPGDLVVALQSGDDALPPGEEGVSENGLGVAWPPQLGTFRGKVDATKLAEAENQALGFQKWKVVLRGG